MIGAHGGSYALYRALAVSSGALIRSRGRTYQHVPPRRSGRSRNGASRSGSCRSIPGATGCGGFRHEIAEGIDIRPTIAITRRGSTCSRSATRSRPGRLEADGNAMHANGERLRRQDRHRSGLVSARHRRTLRHERGRAAPHAVRADRRHVSRARDAARPARVPAADRRHHASICSAMSRGCRDRRRQLTCRVHDECNGSDVFGSDICTCRPYLIHGIEECVTQAQQGGVGLIVYNRKEGRALGEVTKFLVYNARKRQEGGDQAATYFERTECVAGVQDARFQQLMPDVLHWLGITPHRPFRVDVEHEIRRARRPGIEIVERVPIPAGLVPPDAQVEIEAKKAAGYYTPEARRRRDELQGVVGRDSTSSEPGPVRVKPDAPRRCAAERCSGARTGARDAGARLAGGLPHFASISTGWRLPPILSLG